jgi:hypothetical protein
MENTLSKLADIERRMNNIGQEMKRENQVYMKERNERLRLGLTGDDAVRHYNEWMEREGMGHLKVKL